jgi:hypothetical protein
VPADAQAPCRQTFPVAAPLPPDLQQPFDVGIVMATVVRPTLEGAVRSVFAQQFAGRIQILIGVDRWQGDRAAVEQLRAARPSQSS